MEAFLLLAMIVGTDDPPTSIDREKLPSEEFCQIQKCRTCQWCNDLEYRIQLSPSRAHLLEGELKQAYWHREWWSTALTVKQGQFVPEGDIPRMIQLKAMIGREAWRVQDFPLVGPVQ